MVAAESTPDSKPPNYYHAIKDETRPEDKTIVHESDLPFPEVKDEEEEKNITEFIPEPPDGGWGWVIMIAAFFLQFILDGTVYSFGVFLTVYKNYFNSSSAATSAMSSCLIGCYMLSAPVVSALVNKFGCRPVAISGSILSSAAFILSTFSPNIIAMIFLYGVVGGFGFGCLYLTAILSVSQYFDKKRSFAVGIAMCGSGVGTLTYGPVCKVLLTIMDWRTAHYILAAAILNGVVFSSLMRPLKTLHDVKKQKLKKQTERTGVPDEKLVHCTSPDSTKLARRKIKQQVSVHSKYSSGGGSSVRVYRSVSKLGSQQKVTSTLTEDDLKDLKSPIYRQDIFYSGSVQRLPEYRRAESRDEFTASVTAIPSLKSPKKSACPCLPQKLQDSLNEMLDLSLFLNWKFNVIAAFMAIANLVYLVPFLYTYNRAVSLGFDKTTASLLLIFLGLSTTIGRPIINGVTQFTNFNSLHAHNIVLTVAGVACICVPFCSSFTTMAISSFFYGFFSGGHVSLTPIVIVDYLGLHRLTSSAGLITLMKGVAALAGPPIAGKMYDMYGSYDIPFVVAGVFSIVCSVGLSALEWPCFKRRITRHING